MDDDRKGGSEMGEYTAVTSPRDEDGYVNVTITYPDGERSERHTLRHDLAGQWTEQELGILNRMHELGDAECPHGLSAALCSGPQHY